LHIAQVLRWYFVRLCGAAGIRGEMSQEKNLQIYPYSNCTFHHQNSQKQQTICTVPTNLRKILANIIFCTYFFQHVGKQDKTLQEQYGENCIVQVVCWYSVRLCSAAGVCQQW
jgi:hypothetical protein